MKNLRLLGLLAMLGLIILGAAGCSETGVTETAQVAVDDYDDMDMDKAYGGLTMTDEEAAFGDEYFTGTDYLYEEAEADDPLQQETDPTLVADVLAYEDEVANGDPNGPQRPVITVVRMLWGQLDGLPEDITDNAGDLSVYNWSGRLQVDRGIAVVRRVILFERPWDHLLPRPDRRTVAWTSFTGPHFDGLVVQIIEPPVEADPGVTPPPVNMLRLSMPEVGIELAFPMPEVDGLDETYPVDEAGNALRLEGHLLTDVDLCPKGFLGGVWIADPLFDEEGDQVADGFFKGRWVDIFGRMRGYLRGRYGVNDAGEKVFFGKYISRSGRCRGLLAGHYGSDPESGRGAFQGEWINAAETVEGVLGGHYIQIPERPGGFFAGRWATLCDQDAVESIQ
jgi:hypothetical protein